VHRTSSLRWLPFWAALAVALAVRLVFLDVRPLHHDEGVVAAFLLALVRGRPYAYNPAGYHGPFLYYFGYWPLRLLGTGEAALRLPVALASALMLPLLLPLRRRLGVAGVTAAAWLLAVSPFFIYYGRDLIPETWLVLLTLALVAAGSLYLESRRDEHLLLAAACLGLLFTVKETAVLTVAGLLTAAALTRIRTAGGLRLDDLRVDRKTAGLVVLSAAIPYILLFTSFLTHPWGLIDSFRGLALWAGKGAEGAGVHAKPWLYFLKWLLWYEPALLAGGLLGGGLALRRRDPWGSFCAVWLLSQLAIYSAIPYKTPWLALNILLPAALAAGFLVRELWDRRSRAARAGVLAVLLLGLGWSGWRAVEVTFRGYDDPRLEIPYAQTRREAMEIVALVREVAKRAPAGRGLTLHALLPYRWPLPWYLRDFPNARYWKRLRDLPLAFDADVLLVDSREEAKLRPRLKDTYSRRVFPLLPGEWVAVYVNERVELGQARPRAWLVRRSSSSSAPWVSACGTGDVRRATDTWARGSARRSARSAGCRCSRGDAADGLPGPFPSDPAEKQRQHHEIEDGHNEASHGDTALGREPQERSERRETVRPGGGEDEGSLARQGPGNAAAQRAGDQEGTRRQEQELVVIPGDRRGHDAEDCEIGQSGEIVARRGHAAGSGPGDAQPPGGKAGREQGERDGGREIAPPGGKPQDRRIVAHHPVTRLAARRAAVGDAEHRRR
jgi:uncharacterized protein (TIGR03663 family)